MKRRDFILYMSGVVSMFFSKRISGTESKMRIGEIRKKLTGKFGLRKGEQYLIINPGEQIMYLVMDTSVLKTFTISTSRFGLGSESGSNKTPVGTHRVREKIGDRAVIGTIFKGRVATGKIAKIYTDKTDLKEDDITTRILWLGGEEKGKNRGGSRDTHKRFIYIHGTPEEGLLGTPASHGCIRMKNIDVIELFKLIPSGTLVEILNIPFLKYAETNYSDNSSM